MSIVLALETSCDESAVAIIQFEAGQMAVLSSHIASQMKEHAKWGGVVPEIASRRHLEVLPSLVEKAIFDSKHSIKDFDAIAATVTPGLAGALLIGSVTGRTLARLHNLPFLGIHHLEGHLASVQLGVNPPVLPYLVLLVSGGHTELIIVRSNQNFERVGYSHDDAAGEAFDKVARLLNLGYPGGPSIQKAAVKGDSNRFNLPKGRISNPEGGYYPYDFSFSGLKTAMLRKVQTFEHDSELVPVSDLAASFEKVVAEVLVERSFKCLLDYQLKSFVMVGGVAANSRLRSMMRREAKRNSIKLHLAPSELCTDNAAMIGAAALMRLESKVKPSSIDLGVSARWPLHGSSKLYNSLPPF